MGVAGEPMSTLLLLLYTSGEAHATAALDPQNRVHVGLNFAPSFDVGTSGLGVTAGFDSRLTRLVAVDIGGFVSPVPLGDGIAPEDGERPDFVVLRHGLYVTPGLRIPHPQPRTWAWEGFLRAGGGVIWTADTSPDAMGYEGTRYAVQPRIAGALGADVMARFGTFGVRASGKAWLFEVVDESPLQSWVTPRSQFAVEGLVQW
jgi:hypothetical protein